MGLARGRGRGRGGPVKARNRGSPMKPPPLMGRFAPPPRMLLRPRALPVPPLLPRMRPPPPGMRSPRLLPPPPPRPRPHPHMLGGPPRPMPPYRPPPPPHRGHPLPPPRGHPLPPPLPLRPPIPPPSLLRARGQRLPPPPMHGMRPPVFRPLGPAPPMMPKFGPGRRGGLVQRGGKRKPRGNNPEDSEDNDINKPWVTEAMKNEIQKKHKLYQKAKKSNEQSDWDEFKEQRNRVTTMIREAKLEFIGSHPEEVKMRCEPQAGEFYCDTCDRQMKSAEQLVSHIAEHETCGMEGCSFTAHPKVVAKHIEMQHYTGLYKKIGNLYTPEAIAKWITERKKNYPTKQNVEQRHQEKEEKFKRGERLVEDNTRFNRDAPSFGRRGSNRNNRRRGRGGTVGGSRAAQRHKRQAYLQTQVEVEEEEDWKGNLPPFPGIAAFQDDEPSPVKKEDSVAQQEQFSDLEWEASAAPVPEPVISAPAPFSNALNTLMCLYGSDQSDTEDDSPPVILPVIHTPQPSTQALIVDITVQAKTATSTEEQSVVPGERSTEPTLPVSDDGSAPEEVRISYKSLDVEINPNGPSKPQFQQPQPVNNANRKRKRHNRRRNTSQSKSNTVTNDFPSQLKKNVSSKPVAQHYPPKRRRLTLLEKLLSREIRHERNVILQCVRFVADKNFFGIGQSSMLPLTSNNHVSATSDIGHNCGSEQHRMKMIRHCIQYIAQNNFFNRDQCDSSKISEVAASVT